MPPHQAPHRMRTLDRPGPTELRRAPSAASGTSGDGSVTPARGRYSSW
ncbi:hypothetical protein ACTXG6_38010 [Pseudonocardia sp. Cha107L01]